MESTAGSAPTVATSPQPNADLTAFQQAVNYTALNCSRYDKMYAQIQADLEIHRQLGTSLESTRFIADRLGTVMMRGIAAGFFSGRAHLLLPTNFTALSHHAPLHLAYLRMLLHMEDTFGRDLPDVAFVLTTSDTPRYVSPLVVNTSAPRSTWKQYGYGLFVPGPYPVCGIGKSDFFPDLLLVPNFHFHMKRYDTTSLGAIPEYDMVPWRLRKGILFGRFSLYHTNRITEDPTTIKTGLNGSRICYSQARTCPYRKYFVDRVAPMALDRIDVSFGAKVSLVRHTDFKYLMHLDGQGISSRLEQLLPMGSLVIKQASGYYAYYYKTLLRDRVNLLEFWRTSPDEVLAALDWAAAHDQEARAVAEEGRRTAERYLTGAGRTCYWYRLLHGLRSTLSYTPSLDQWPRAVPLREALAEQLRITPGGQQLGELPWEP